MILKPICEVSEKEIRSFSCGNGDLDNYFKRFASINDKNGYGKTFVLFDQKELVGFFTLCSASIKFEDIPIHHSLPKYPIPAIRIARLAVQRDKQGKGYGKELLKSAFLRILSVSQNVGIRLILVDAKGSSASFYEHYGFMKLKQDSLTYYLALDTLIEAL